MYTWPLRLFIEDTYLKWLEQSSQPMGPFLSSRVRNLYRPRRSNGLGSRPKPLYSKVDTQGTILTKFQFDICITHRAEVDQVHLAFEAVHRGHLFKVTSCIPEQSSQPMGPFLCSRVRNLYRPRRSNGLWSRPKPLYFKLDLQGNVLRKFHPRSLSRFGGVRGHTYPHTHISTQSKSKFVLG